MFCQAKATINRSTRKSDIKTRNKRRMNEIRNRYYEKKTNKRLKAVYLEKPIFKDFSFYIHMLYFASLLGTHCF